MTDAIFAFLEGFLRQGTKRDAIFSLEKRVVFTTDGFRVAAPAYEYFRTKFDLLDGPTSEMRDSNSKRLYGRQIPLPPQYFVDYERTKELELWNIST